MWGNMRTAASETVPQITLRNCSKEVGGGGQYICDFGERGIHVIEHICFAEGFDKSGGVGITMKDFSAFLDMRRCTNRAHTISS